jgi:hypothetical protein
VLVGVAIELREHVGRVLGVDGRAASIPRFIEKIFGATETLSDRDRAQTELNVS